MRKHALLALVAVVLLLGLTGCYCTPVRPPMGWVVSNYKAPLSADNQGVAVDTSKHGQAKVENYLGIVAVGDCSLNAAVEDGGIGTVSFADYEYFNVLGVYQKFVVHAYGN